MQRELFNKLSTIGDGTVIIKIMPIYSEFESSSYYFGKKTLGSIWGHKFTPNLLGGYGFIRIKTKSSNIKAVPFKILFIIKYNYIYM